MFPEVYQLCPEELVCLVTPNCNHSTRVVKYQEGFSQGCFVIYIINYALEESRVELERKQYQTYFDHLLGVPDVSNERREEPIGNEEGVFTEEAEVSDFIDVW